MTPRVAFGYTALLAVSLVIGVSPQSLVAAVAPVAAGQTARSMPDLQVERPKATAVCVANTSITATLQAMVRNRGNATADLSKITWHIVLGASWAFTGGPGNLVASNTKTVNPQVGGPLELKPGESWTGTMTITGIPKPKPGADAGWTYVFEIVADPLSGVTESNETNNSSKVFANNPCPK